MSINLTPFYPGNAGSTETSGSTDKIEPKTWTEDQLRVINELINLYQLSVKWRKAASWSEVADHFYERTGCRRSIASLKHKVDVLLKKEENERYLKKRYPLRWDPEEVKVLEQIMEANKDEQDRIGWSSITRLLCEKTGKERTKLSVKGKGIEILEKKHRDARDSTIPRVNNHTDGVQKKRKPESLNPDTLRLALSSESSQSPSNSNSPTTLSCDENSTEDFSKLSSEELIKRMFDRLSELPDTLDLEPNEALINAVLDEPPSPLSEALYNKRNFAPDESENIES